MKSNKRQKSEGMKHRVRAEKKREERIALTVTVALLIAIIFVSGLLIPPMLKQPSTNSPSVSKVAIVDHLSLTYSNQTFVETTTNTLKQAGYAVDYYRGEEVTVEFYRNLPAHNYAIIILRVHSSATQSTGSEAPVTLFTSERVSTTKHVYEQMTDQLMWVSYSGEEKEKGIEYFGISPLFVTQSMRGRFQNTVIIMMGCEGLENSLMAKAFVEKGAKVYISWDGSVSASHTDTATTHLLQHFLIERRTVDESLLETFKEVGSDPVYESLLDYYPVEACDYAI